MAKTLLRGNSTNRVGLRRVTRSGFFVRAKRHVKRSRQIKKELQAIQVLLKKKGVSPQRQRLFLALINFLRKTRLPKKYPVLAKSPVPRMGREQIASALGLVSWHWQQEFLTWSSGKYKPKKGQSLIELGLENVAAAIHFDLTTGEWIRSKPDFARISQEMDDLLRKRYGAAYKPKRRKPTS
ncbi:hypothetical protein KKE06_02145 [Candidatus Micrarchaeota archaeon]|nr:hypothetical protein [Candidatus Micrarchaeota archaeon]MBU1930227.1 hypothetical protein [Candidatus Micrarchaeota archaeon]